MSRRDEGLLRGQQGARICACGSPLDDGRHRIAAANRIVNAEVAPPKQGHQDHEEGSS